MGYLVFIGLYMHGGTLRAKYKYIVLYRVRVGLLNPTVTRKVAHSVLLIAFGYLHFNFLITHGARVPTQYFIVLTSTKKLLL